MFIKNLSKIRINLFRKPKVGNSDSNYGMAAITSRLCFETAERKPDGSIDTYTSNYEQKIQNWNPVTQPISSRTKVPMPLPLIRNHKYVFKLSSTYSRAADGIPEISVTSEDHYSESLLPDPALR